MAILPVLDLMRGQIVRGIAGRRESYRPIESRLTSSADPAMVADGAKCEFWLSRVLSGRPDAIEQGVQACGVYAKLRERSYRLWIDAGIRREEDADGELLDPDCSGSVVVGLEEHRRPRSRCGELWRKRGRRE